SVDCKGTARAVKQRIAVGLRFRRELGGDDAGGARTIVDVELLAMLSREPLSDDAREDVGCLADREAEQDAHRLGGIALRPRGGAQSKEKKQRADHLYGQCKSTSGAVPCCKRKD